MTTKQGSGLKECLGLLKKDIEWKETEKTLERGWSRWTKKYVSDERFEFSQD